MVEVAERRLLGSLSEPGIFQGPGDTVAFLPAMLLPLLMLVVELVCLEIWLDWVSPAPLSGSFSFDLPSRLPLLLPLTPASVLGGLGDLGTSRFLDWLLPDHSLGRARLLLAALASRGAPATSSKCCSRCP